MPPQSLHSVVFAMVAQDPCTMWLCGGSSLLTSVLKLSKANISTLSSARLENQQATTLNVSIGSQQSRQQSQPALQLNLPRRLCRNATNHFSCPSLQSGAVVVTARRETELAKPSIAVRTRPHVCRIQGTFTGKRSNCPARPFKVMPLTLTVHACSEV